MVDSGFEIKCPCGKKVYYREKDDLWVHEEGEPCPKLNLYEPETLDLRVKDPYSIATKKPDLNDLIAFLEQLKEVNTKIAWRILLGLIIPLRELGELPVLDIDLISTWPKIRGILKRVFGLNAEIPLELNQEKYRRIIQLVRKMSRELDPEKMDLLRGLELISKRIIQ